MSLQNVQSKNQIEKFLPVIFVESQDNYFSEKSSKFYNFFNQASLEQLGVLS